MIFDKAFDITAKSLSGEEISDEDKKYLAERNRKYELVRYLVIEHNRYKGKAGLKDFHFSPGESFDETSALDIANAIVNIDLSNSKPIKRSDLD